MNINVYREYAKSILENMLDNTLIDISRAYISQNNFAQYPKKIRDPISHSKKWPNGPKTISRYCPFKGQVVSTLQVQYKYDLS